MRSACSAVIVVCAALMMAGQVSADEARRQGEGQEPIQKMELNDAYRVGYDDAVNGRAARTYYGDPRSSSAGQGQVARGAGRGALGGAAIGGLSEGDKGKGAAWGAAMGAARGAAERRREQDAARMRELELNDAYRTGYEKGLKARAPQQPQRSAGEYPSPW